MGLNSSSAVPAQTLQRNRPPTPPKGPGICSWHRGSDTRTQLDTTSPCQLCPQCRSFGDILPLTPNPSEKSLLPLLWNKPGFGVSVTADSVPCPESPRAAAPGSQEFCAATSVLPARAPPVPGSSASTFPLPGRSGSSREHQGVENIGHCPRAASAWARGRGNCSGWEREPQSLGQPERDSWGSQGMVPVGKDL